MEMGMSMGMRRGQPNLYIMEEKTSANANSVRGLSVTSASTTAVVAVIVFVAFVAIVVGVLTRRSRLADIDTVQRDSAELESFKELN